MSSCDERFEIQARKKVRNYPFLMGEGVWLDSEKLGWDDEVREVLKHGTLSVGFIGLAETLVALIGEHHGQSERAQKLGLEDHRPHARALRRAERGEEAELHAAGDPGGGAVRPVCQDRPEALRQDRGRDRSRVLHQQLPHPGVLSDQRV